MSAERWWCVTGTLSHRSRSAVAAENRGTGVRRRRVLCAYCAVDVSRWFLRFKRYYFSLPFSFSRFFHVAVDPKHNNILLCPRVNAASLSSHRECAPEYTRAMLFTRGGVS